MPFEFILSNPLPLEQKRIQDQKVGGRRKLDTKKVEKYVKVERNNQAVHQFISFFLLII